MSPSHDSWCMLDNFFSSQRPLFSISGRCWSPPVDVSETPERILIRLEVAGLKEEDFSILVDRDLLTVRGRRRDVALEEHEEFHAKEIRYGCFERSFRLPREALSGEIRASYCAGFLKIEIPKGEEAPRSIQIPVESD